jgi:hypothetical protein
MTTGNQRSLHGRHHHDTSFGVLTNALTGLGPTLAPPVVGTATGFPPDCPTKTHALLELQLTALTAVTELGIDWFEVHEVPPFELVRIGAAVPLYVDPAAAQLPREHETTSSVAEPTGIATELHVAPPSVVTSSKAVAVGSCATLGLAPIATHVVAVAHETERSTPVPPFTVRCVQVAPPSLLTTIDAPTDTQKLVVGQSTEPSAPVAAGSVGVVQLTPPSDETSNWPA